MHGASRRLPLWGIPLLGVGCAPTTIQPMPPMPDFDPPRQATGAAAGAVREAVVDRPPAQLAAPALRYPPHLRDQGIQGWVLLEFVIDTLGLPEPATIHTVAFSHPDFVPPAIQAVRDSRYRPGYLQGVPVRVLVRQPVQFGLQNQAAERVEQQTFGAAYVTNLPKQVLGVAFWYVPQRSIGLYLDVKSGVPFRDQASNFFGDLTVEEVETVFGDPFVRTDPNWMSINAALTKGFTPRLALYLGGGVSARFEYLEYRDRGGVLVDRGDTYWIEEDGTRRYRPNVIAGALIKLSSKLRLQLGGELKPMGLTVGLGFHPRI